MVFFLKRRALTIATDASHINENRSPSYACRTPVVRLSYSLYVERSFGGYPLIDGYQERMHFTREGMTIRCPA